MTAKTRITEMREGTTFSRAVRADKSTFGPTESPFPVESSVITLQTLPLEMTVQWKLAA